MTTPFLIWTRVLGEGSITLRSGDSTIAVKSSRPPTAPEFLSVFRGPQGERGEIGPTGPASGEDLPDLTLIFENGLV